MVASQKDQMSRTIASSVGLSLYYSLVARPSGGMRGRTFRGNSRFARLIPVAIEFPVALAEYRGITSKV